MVRFASFALLLGLTGCPSKPAPQTSAPPPPRADLVLYGGIVHTLDNALPGAAAVAVKDGAVVDVGDDAGLQPWIGGKTKKFDLRGRAVVPGFHDAHMHFAGLGQRRIALDLIGTQSIEEIQGKLAEAVAKAEPGQWILGRGWDQNDWQGRRAKRFPVAQDLDKVSRDNPVILTRVDGHAIWVNSAALKAAKITRRTRSPSGGRLLTTSEQRPV